MYLGILTVKCRHLDNSRLRQEEHYGEDGKTDEPDCAEWSFPGITPFSLWTLPSAVVFFKWRFGLGINLFGHDYVLYARLLVGLISDGEHPWGSCLHACDLVDEEFRCGAACLIVVYEIACESERRIVEIPEDGSVFHFLQRVFGAFVG